MIGYKQIYNLVDVLYNKNLNTNTVGVYYKNVLSIVHCNF
jgi:hypothetical protein